MSNFAHTASAAGLHARELLLQAAGRRRRATHWRYALTLLAAILLVGLALAAPLLQAAFA